jgi:predicted nucleic acid-binding protein
MSPSVIDASVMAKLFYEERGSNEARRAIEEASLGNAPMHVPGLIFAELLNVGLKKIHDRMATEQDARGMIEVMGMLPLAVWPCHMLVAAGLEISVALGTSSHDSLYLALAERVDGHLLTADEEMLEATRGTHLESRLKLLGGA